MSDEFDDKSDTSDMPLRTRQIAKMFYTLRRLEDDVKSLIEFRNQIAVDQATDRANLSVVKTDTTKNEHRIDKIDREVTILKAKLAVFAGAGAVVGALAVEIFKSFVFKGG